jgi:putative transposase
MTAPNVIWTADYKGQFKLGDRGYCYPLTVQDGFSRYRLACRGLTGTTYAECRPVFTRLFQEYGLPEILRTDNGVPFATGALGRLSQLSVWWIRLGIYPELIEPAHPEQNGRHERMHRTLKRATARPPAPTPRSQQRRFDVFREEYNTVRPHEALADETPASIYGSSPRSIPAPCRRSSTQCTSKSASSAPMVAFAGRKRGSMSATSWRANTSASKRSTTASGTCTLDR